MLTTMSYAPSLADELALDALLAGLDDLTRAAIERVIEEREQTARDEGYADAKDDAEWEKAEAVREREAELEQEMEAERRQMDRECEDAYRRGHEEGYRDGTLDAGATIGPA